MSNLQEKKSPRQLAIDLVRYMAAPGPRVAEIRRYQEEILDACVDEARQTPWQSPRDVRQEELIAGARVESSAGGVESVDDDAERVRALAAMYGPGKQRHAAMELLLRRIHRLEDRRDGARNIVSRGMDMTLAGVLVGEDFKVTPASRIFETFRSIALVLAAVLAVVGCGGPPPDGPSSTCENACAGAIDPGHACMSECLTCEDEGGTWELTPADGYGCKR
jgi:hypothetical protein